MFLLWKSRLHHSLKVAAFCLLGIGLALLAHICGLYTISPYTLESGQEAMMRLHIIANSDTAEDQQVKLLVRDAILREYTQALADCDSVQACMEAAAHRLPDIQETAKRVLKENGKAPQVQATLGLYDFPDRTYGTLLVPAGQYNALRVVLGDGAGQNWWCVMYPPLCFVDQETLSAPSEIYFDSAIISWFTQNQQTKALQDLRGSGTDSAAQGPKPSVVQATDQPTGSHTPSSAPASALVSPTPSPAAEAIGAVGAGSIPEPMHTPGPTPSALVSRTPGLVQAPEPQAPIQEASGAEPEAASPSEGTTCPDPFKGMDDIYLERQMRLLARVGAATPSPTAPASGASVLGTPCPLPEKAAASQSIAPSQAVQAAPPLATSKPAQSTLSNRLFTDFLYGQGISGNNSR